MRSLTVYKNADGYGPRRRPKLLPGDVRNLVSDDGTINKVIKAVAVDADRAGNRCRFCDLNIGENNHSGITCICNSDNLKSDRHPWPVSICTLRASDASGDGVFVVFKDLSKIMEDL
jgi:hypothetical protein